MDGFILDKELWFLEKLYIADLGGFTMGVIGTAGDVSTARGFDSLDDNQDAKDEDEADIVAVDGVEIAKEEKKSDLALWFLDKLFVFSITIGICLISLVGDGEFSASDDDKDNLEGLGGGMVC